MSGEGASLPSPDTSPRVTLPSNLSGSLKYLDDAELRRLRAAVSAEIERRDGTVSKNSPDARRDPGKEAGQIPEGKANLIRASLKAGLKPGAIARTLGLSPALVRRVLHSRETP
jgi:hypothetical protein